MSEDKKFVSRGGIKLEHALNTFHTLVADMLVLDVGSSTGGFIDCLLQHKVAKVYSVDTAYGELAWKLRQDPRVVVIERKNILDLSLRHGSGQADLPEMIDLITIDVTFTSLTKILPAVKKFLKPGGKIIALLKPQYEDSELALRHHGVIPETSVKGVVENVRFKIQELGFKIDHETESPILGGGGNKEFLFLISTQ